MGAGHHAPALTGPDATRDGLRTILISAAVLLVSATVRFVVVAITGSVALLAAALDDLGDVLTTSALFLAFKASRRAADNRYTFGYQRLEDLGGVLVVLVIWAGALFAAYEALDKLFGDHRVTHLALGMVVAGVGAAANGLVALYKIRTGKRIGSKPLVADGKHAATDSLASIAALVGLAAVAAGFPKADPIAAFAVVLAIGWIAFDATRQVLTRLLDAVDPELIHEMGHVVESVEGVRACGRIQARWAGRSLYVIATVAADGSLPLTETHAISERVHHALLHEIEGVSQVDVHVDPWEPHADDAHRDTADHRGAHVESDDREHHPH
ncbi:MAG: cation diffusion facilitator family transporter [Actinomycetota bacterium]|nr:cation diffusion facilitator family transporter [Actinomycetota bacterium]